MLLEVFFTSFSPSFSVMNIYNQRVKAFFFYFENDQDDNQKHIFFLALDRFHCTGNVKKGDNALTHVPSCGETPKICWSHPCP